MSSSPSEHLDANVFAWCVLLFDSVLAEVKNDNLRYLYPESWHLPTQRPIRSTNQGVQHQNQPQFLDNQLHFEHHPLLFLQVQEDEAPSQYDVLDSKETPRLRFQSQRFVHQQSMVCMRGWCESDSFLLLGEQNSEHHTFLRTSEAIVRRLHQGPSRIPFLPNDSDTHDERPISDSNPCPPRVHREKRFHPARDRRRLEQIYAV